MGRLLDWLSLVSGPIASSCASPARGLLQLLAQLLAQWLQGFRRCCFKINVWRLFRVRSCDAFLLRAGHSLCQRARTRDSPSQVNTHTQHIAPQHHNMPVTKQFQLPTDMAWLQPDQHVFETAQEREAYYEAKYNDLAHEQEQTTPTAAAESANDEPAARAATPGTGSPHNADRVAQQTHDVVVDTC